MNLRERAKGMACFLRLPGCNSDRETTVLCHLRIGGVAGMGQKPPDVCAVPACVTCHEILDGRLKSALTPVEIRAEAARALCQWLAYAWEKQWVKAA